MAQPVRIILVYNAKGGIRAMLKDGLHKLLRPETYPCSLCALTYGAVSMRRAWRRFLDCLPHAKVFHHKDDFAAAFPAIDIALPAILIAQQQGTPEILVSAAELNALPDLDALIALVTQRLASRR